MPLPWDSHALHSASCTSSASNLSTVPYAITFLPPGRFLYHLEVGVYGAFMSV